MKQLNVTLMDLWTSPSEIHITLLELCVSEIPFEFVQNQIWLNYFFSRLSQVKLCWVCGSLNWKIQGSRWIAVDGCFCFRAISDTSTVVVTWSSVQDLPYVGVTNLNLLLILSFLINRLHLLVYMSYYSYLLPFLIFGFLPCLPLLCPFHLHSYC